MLHFEKKHYSCNTGKTGDPHDPYDPQVIKRGKQSKTIWGS